MPTRFPGFPSEGVAFLRGLEKNNNRDWFQPRKAVFEEKVKAPMVALVEAINRELVKFAPDHVTEPKAAIYRIYRDTRFSKDKTPYKPFISANFPRRGLDKHAAGGYYFHVSPKEIIVAGGCYMPGPEQLLAIRNHVAANQQEFEKLIRGKKLKSTVGEMQGEKLSRPPKGFAKDHPAIDLLRHKQWYFYASLDPKLAATPALFTELMKCLRAMAPVVDFLNTPLLGKKRPDPLKARATPSSRRRAR